MAEAHSSGETKPLTRGDLERLHLEGFLTDDAFASALTHWDGTRAWRAFATRWLNHRRPRRGPQPPLMRMALG